MTALRLNEVSVVRSGKPILDRVTASVRTGQLVGLVGPNGAGKSTLLRTAAGLLRPDLGGVDLDGQDLRRWPRPALARRIAYLPQHPECHRSMAVGRVVALGRLPHLTTWQRPSDKDRAAIGAAMAATDVTHLGERRAGSLSGGEHARVMLARALAAEPSMLLADEPVADLDPYHSLDVMDRLEARARGGACIVVVLHDLTLAARYCERIILMDHGRIVADGAPEETLSVDRLAAVYRIAAVTGQEDGKPYLLPWTRLPDDRGPP